jgi:hypothetical protein
MKPGKIVSRFYCAYAALFLLCCFSAAAQVSTGFPPFNSISTAPGGPETVDPATLNIHWTFPVYSKNGRGIPISFNLSYDSSVWYQVPINPYSTYWYPLPNWGWGFPATQMTGMLTANQSGDTEVCPDDPSVTAITYKISYQAPNGTTHFIGYYYDIEGDCDTWQPPNSPWVDYGSDQGFRLLTFDAVSGSGSVITPSGATLVMPVSWNGGAPNSLTSSLTDSNGNVASMASNGTITDTQGNYALTVLVTCPKTLRTRSYDALRAFRFKDFLV